MHNWYQVDETRETWTFLCLERNPQSGELSQWALGVGNTSHLVRTSQQSRSNVATERTLLTQLGEEVETSREIEPVVVTPTPETLALLRRRLVANNAIETPSLRGFRHVAVTQIIDEYFGGSRPDHGETKRGSGNPSVVCLDWDEVEEPTQDGIEQLWRYWTNLVPVVPAQALTGVAL